MKKYTIKELAEKYNVNPRIATGWCQRGVFPNAEKNYRWLVPESDLKGFKPKLSRGVPLLSNPSKRTLYARIRREYLKKQAEPAGQELPPFHLSKRIDQKFDEMLRLYQKEQWTLRQIGDHFGVSIGTIGTRLARAGIERRPPQPTRRLIARETLVELYVIEKLSLNQVAKRLKTTYRKICEELKRHGLEKR